MTKQDKEMTKTKEYIRVVFLGGKEQKRTIYVDENGKKYVYNQRHFWKLEDFIRYWNVI